VVDTRGQHPLMLVHDVNVQNIAKVLSFFPGQKFILHNLFLGEISDLHHFLPNVYFDLASLETQNILRKLHEQYTLDRFLFSSHAPFYYPEGNINKLVYADIESGLMEKVAYKNAEMLFEGT
jgi:predicted TIM-barrel fold metal-dependent hydrolase